MAASDGIVVPAILPVEMKSFVHQGRLGIESCKQYAKQSLFWPLIKNEIEGMVRKCPTCLAFRNRQPSEATINHPISNQTWKKML